MSAAAIVTLIAVGLTVAALAAYLVHVILLLRHTHFTLGTIVAALRAISHQSRPIGEVLEDVNADLAEVHEALDSILGADLDVEEAPVDEQADRAQV